MRGSWSADTDHEVYFELIGQCINAALKYTVGQALHRVVVLAKAHYFLNCCPPLHAIASYEPIDCVLSSSSIINLIITAYYDGFF